MSTADHVDAEGAGLGPLQAYEAVRRFARQAGPTALRLALHASIPQVLQGDLLHLLRLNFVDDGSASPVAEADVLFAPFTDDLGNGYYRFDAHARQHLLRELDVSFAGEQRERSVRVADFLLAYCERESRAERGETDAMYRSWLEVERWNALAFADPDAAAEQLAAALARHVDAAQTRARLRLGALARSLAQPLVRHHKLLVYAAGVQALQHGEIDEAQVLLARLGDQPLEVGTQVLPGAATLLAAAAPGRAEPKKARQAVETTAEPATGPVEDTPTPEPSSPPPAPAEPQRPKPAPPLAASGWLLSLVECEYSVYLSYSHADDEACFGWVRQFGKELERGMAAVLRGVKLPPLYWSGESGLVSGDLSAQMHERIGRAFALVIVVHDNYVQSEWALKELEYFVSVFGERGVRDRLYVIALSEPAMQLLAASRDWQRVMRPDQVWLPFFEDEQRDQPVPVYMGPQLVSPQFREKFLRLRADLVGKLRASMGSSVPERPVYPPMAPPEDRGGPDGGPRLEHERAQPGPARLYIESNRHELNLWQPLGERLRRHWSRLTAGSPDPGSVPALAPRGLPIEQIDQYPSLDDADGVVLLWGRKTADALVAQINKVENKLSPGRDAAPGIVAYLMPPQEITSDPVPAWGWQVLRIDARQDEALDVVDDEAELLMAFLRRVLERWRRRAADEAAPPAGRIS